MNTGRKKWDVIVVGELNVDIILNGIHSFPEMGKDIQADDFSFVLGSSSAICASNIASLGARVAFCGLIGKDYFGDFVLEQLKARDIDTSMVIRTDEDRTGMTFILNFDNDRASVTYHGTMALTTPEMIPFEDLDNGSHFHLSSCFLLPEILPRLPEIYQRAKNSGLTTSLDPQWDPRERWDLDLGATMDYLDVFFPNETELLNITNGKDLKDAMKNTCKGDGIIAVKQGTLGSTVYSERSGFIHQGGYLNPDIADAIGAGDSFNAGFIYQFIKGSELEECQDFGNLTGAFSTTKSGGTAAFSEPVEVLKNLQEYKNKSVL
jgi:sugar/nucleoside kinase (ribokinase family)